MNDFEPPSDDPANFAYPAGKKYPIHNKAALWVSARKFALEESSYPEPLRQLIRRNILNQAALFDVENDIKEAMDGVKSEDGKPISDDLFGLTITTPMGKRALIPLATADQVKEAADFLVSSRYDLPFSLRHEIAKKILKRAEELDVYLGSKQADIERTACLGEPESAEAVVSAIKYRLAALKAANLDSKIGPQLSVLENMTNLIKQSPNVVNKPEVKWFLCSIMDNIDLLTDVRSEAKTASDEKIWCLPEDIVCAVNKTMKEAMDRDRLELPGAGVFSRAKVSLLKADVFEGIGNLQKSAADDLGYVDPDKLAAAFNDLSEEQKRIVVSILQNQS